MTGFKNGWDYSCSLPFENRSTKSPKIKYFQILNGQISDPHYKVFFVTWLNNLNYGHSIVRYSKYSDLRCPYFDHGSKSCLGATLPFQSHTHFYTDKHERQLNQQTWTLSTPTNMNHHYTDKHEARVVTQPFLYVCYALDICDAKSHAPWLSISMT